MVSQYKYRNITTTSNGILHVQFIENDMSEGFWESIGDEIQLFLKANRKDYSMESFRKYIKVKYPNSHWELVKEIPK